MRDADELTVQEIYGKAWKVGEVDPIGRHINFLRWLDAVRETGARLRSQPGSRLEGGPYDGGHVVALDTGPDRLYYQVPARAIGLLRGYLPHEEYEDLASRERRQREKAQ